MFGLLMIFLFIGVSLGSLCPGDYHPSVACVECQGDNDGCPDASGDVSICGGYGDCDSNDDCAVGLICGTANCIDVTYGETDDPLRILRDDTHWDHDSYCSFDRTDDCCQTADACFHGDNLLLLDSGATHYIHNLSKLEKYEVMNQNGSMDFVTMDLWATKEEIDPQIRSSEVLYMEICVEESCVTVTDNHAIAFRNELDEHDFKIAQKVHEGDMIFMRDAEYGAVTRVESKMMNTSLYVPINLKGYTYIMFGDLAVPIWGDYSGANITSQGPLYDVWMEYFGTHCYMDTLFGHCTALMEGDGMANIVRQIMDASMDYARSDNNITTENYDKPSEFMHDNFADLEWLFWIAENIIWFSIGLAILLIGIAVLSYVYCCKSATASINEDGANAANRPLLDA